MMSNIWLNGKSPLASGELLVPAGKEASIPLHDGSRLRLAFADGERAWQAADGVLTITGGDSDPFGVALELDLTTPAGPQQLHLAIKSFGSPVMARSVQYVISAA